MEAKVLKIYVQLNGDHDRLVVSMPVNVETKSLDLDVFQGIVNIVVGLCTADIKASQYREILERALAWNEVEEG